MSIVLVTCLVLSGSARQTLQFEFSPQESIALAHRLGVHDPRQPGFQPAVCSHLQDALESTEADIAEGVEYSEEHEEGLRVSPLVLAPVASKGGAK